MKYIKDVKVTVGQLRSLRSIWQRSVQTKWKQLTSAFQKAGVFKFAKHVALEPQSNLWKGLWRKSLVINLIKRAVILSLRLLPSPAPGAAGCFSPASKQKQRMSLKCSLFLLTIYALKYCFCETENNSTSSIRMEILEQQTRNAYQNACFRLQELSNWMTVVFRIKSVWASSTVNDIAARSENALNDAVRRIVPSSPARSKTVNSECSLRSIQVTAQTYAYLQGQMLLLKMMVGSNAIKSSREKLDSANEKLKLLDVFNTTLKDIVSKLKISTQESARSNSENWNAWNIIKDIQEGRFLQYLQDSKSFFIRAREENVFNDSAQSAGDSGSFFQNLGKKLDKIIFPQPKETSLNSSNEESNAQNNYS